MQYSSLIDCYQSLPPEDNSLLSVESNDTQTDDAEGTEELKAFSFILQEYIWNYNKLDDTFLRRSMISEFVFLRGANFKVKREQILDIVWAIVSSNPNLYEYTPCYIFVTTRIEQLVQPYSEAYLRFTTICRFTFQKVSQPLQARRKQNTVMMQGRCFQLVMISLRLGICELQWISYSFIKRVHLSVTNYHLSLEIIWINVILENSQNQYHEMKKKYKQTTFWPL